jgi:hypothetical protein
VRHFLGQWRVSLVLLRHACEDAPEEAGMARKTQAPELLGLLAKAHDALKLTQRELGERLEVSLRTVSRWYTGGTLPGAHVVARLAHAVYPVDAELAEQLMAVATSELTGLGLAPPEPLPIAKAPPRATPRAVDGVVCAACEAMDASPRAVRPALLAAVRAARDLGMTLDDLERDLSPPARAQKKG